MKQSVARLPRTAIILALVLGLLAAGCDSPTAPNPECGPPYPDPVECFKGWPS